jgi:hypothetical protein
MPDALAGLLGDIALVPNAKVAPGALINGASYSGALLDKRMRVRPGVWYAHPETVAAIADEFRSLEEYGVRGLEEVRLRSIERMRWDDDGGAA